MQVGSSGDAFSVDGQLKVSKRKADEGALHGNGVALDFCVGSLLIVNFLVVWAGPIAIQGLIWKHTPVSTIARYLHDLLGAWTRPFAQRSIYTQARSADYFPTSVLVAGNVILGLGTVFYYHLLSPGYVPPLVVVLYLFNWAGPGGRQMGGVYALAHREGHMQDCLYQKNVRFNYFENIIGCFYGIVPHSFATSHVTIHHSLAGGPGDTFYLWDLDRSSLSDFAIYVARIFRHMICWSSLRYYRANGHSRQHAKLSRGVLVYACVAVAVLGLTQSPLFLFWFVLQPLFCMTVFLAVLNVGFHGFYEEAEGKAVQSVVSSTILEGDDDYWGEDDHMAHHAYPVLHHEEIPALHIARVLEFSKTRASVFRNLSSLELGLFILLRLWERLADHYVDYSGQLDMHEIKALLQTRAQRRQNSPVQYAAFLAEGPSKAAKAKYLQ